jgi:hypothetical protein
MGKGAESEKAEYLVNKRTGMKGQARMMRTGASSNSRRAKILIPIKSLPLIPIVRDHLQALTHNRCRMRPI